MARKVKTIRSDKDTHFTTAISGTSGYEVENLTGLTSDNITIKGVAIHSDQRLGWGVAFYKTDAFGATNQDSDVFAGVVRFANVDTRIPTVGADGALQANPASKSQYVGYAECAIPYTDADATNELHVALMNMSGTIKTATTGGEVVVECFYEDNLNY